MDDKVLLVDDDQNLLQAAKRHLRKRFAVFTALGGTEGLKLIEQEGPFAVIVSDLSMPGMDGMQFLMRVREAAPNTVRMMLTGHADLHTAMTAVNDGTGLSILDQTMSSRNPRQSDIAGNQTISAGHRRARIAGKNAAREAS